MELFHSIEQHEQLCQSHRMVWTNGTCWRFKKVKCFLWLMVWDGLPSSWPEFLFFPFTQVLDCYFNSNNRATIIELSYLVKPSRFNMSMSVKTVECLSNKMFDNVEFLMTMHVCKEELSHFLVFLIISFQKVLNL